MSTHRRLPTEHVYEELEMGKNPNQNAGFSKNRTEPYPVNNPSEIEPKCHGSYSVLSLNETVGTFTNFTVNEEFYST